MEDLLTTPQPSEEYKRLQNKLISNTIEEMGLIHGEGKNDKQKGNKESSPQQSDSVVENLIKDFGL